MAEPTTAVGALIAIAMLMATGLGWLLRHLLATTLPGKEKDAKEDRALFASEAKAARDQFDIEAKAARSQSAAEAKATRELFERRQQATLEHCEQEAAREREATERRSRETNADLKKLHADQFELILKVNQGVRDTVHLVRGLQQVVLLRDRLADAVAPEGAVYGKTLNGVVTSWSPACERIYGWAGEEMIGQPVYRLVPPDRRGEEEEALRLVRAGEKVEYFETERLAKDGSRVRVDVKVSPVRTPAGEVVGALTTVREV